MSGVCVWGFKECEVHVSEGAGYQLEGRMSLEGRDIGSGGRKEGSEEGGWDTCGREMCQSLKLNFL